MSAPPVVRDLVVAHTRMLKLPGVPRTFESLARQARDNHWRHEDYLHEVLSAEEASRHESVMPVRLWTSLWGSKIIATIAASTWETKAAPVGPSHP
jgi:hypothetical protein